MPLAPAPPCGNYLGKGGPGLSKTPLGGCPACAKPLGGCLCPCPGVCNPINSCLAMYCPTVPVNYSLWIPPLTLTGPFGFFSIWCGVWSHTGEVFTPTVQFTTGRFYTLAGAPRNCGSWGFIGFGGNGENITSLRCGDGISTPADSLVLTIEWYVAGAGLVMRRVYTLPASSWNCSGNNALIRNPQFDIGQCLMPNGHPEFPIPGGTDLWPDTLTVYPA